MEFTPRIQQILRIMLDSKGPVNKQEIADDIGVSKRTVQREFEYLELCIKRYGLKLTNHKGIGVEIQGSPENIEKLREDLGDQQYPDAADREGRRRRLLFELLRDRTPHKLFYYSQLLGVSEATAGSDMDALCPWLEESRLGIVKRPGYGVILEGDERDYREAMRRFIEETAGQSDAYSSGDITGEIFAEALLDAADSGIYSLLEGDTVRRVDKVLRGLNEPKILQLADSAYAGLVIHISIVIERLQQGAALKSVPPEMGDLEFWDDYDLAVRILEAMEKEFEILIPRGELSYVLLHIRGAKMAYTGEEQEFPSDLGDDRLLPMIDRMIDVYNKDIANELKEDEEFLRGLLVHLRPVLVRLSTGLRIHNPILEDIKEEYAEIFEACRRAAQVITEETGYEVNEEEVGFLAMHFGAAQERVKENKQYTRKVNIGIVCASGFGVARLMMTRLKDKLGDKAILKAYGKGEINKYVITGTDFFVSTMNLDQLPVDYLQVSPLIPPKDLNKIEYKLEDYSHIRRDTTETPFNRRLDEAYFLIREIKSIIRRYKRMETSETIRFRELLQFMTMQVTDSLHAAAALRDGIEARERLNSQIFPELGIALLHCRSGAVREPVCISCTPRGDGNFKDPYFKGIRAALLMCMPVDDDRKMHAEVLGSISGSMITNPYFLKLIKTGREDEIRAELAKELKCFFFDYLDRV
ncbi:MAG: BglG family transcription antiterminator [Lachnospiraceae bacterium]|nr:BglG family transcription antiterminator [Lachnospiraceae bacterium]